jgi:hypothetical protein
MLHQPNKADFKPKAYQPSNSAIYSRIDGIPVSRS